MRFSLTKQEAFTLIELLVVISIIGLLSSIILASINQARAKARDTQRVQDLVQIRNALGLYSIDNNGRFPSAGISTQTGDWPTNFKTALSRYISKVPIDPVRNVTGPPKWQYYVYMNCDNTNAVQINGNTGNNCYWLNSPQAGQVCANKIILAAYGTEGKVNVQQCPVNNPNVITVIVSE